MKYLALSIPTWPRILTTHDCAFLGKWYLGGHGAADRQPEAHGFTELACFDAGASQFFKWHAQWNRTQPHFPSMTAAFRVGTAGKPTGETYLPDDEKVRAVRFIKSRAGKPNPFVLYYCPFAVHTPFQHRPKPSNTSLTKNSPNAMHP